MDKVHNWDIYTTTQMSNSHIFKAEYVTRILFLLDNSCYITPEFHRSNNRSLSPVESELSIFNGLLIQFHFIILNVIYSSIFDEYGFM
jgi:hypothetical protein